LTRRSTDEIIGTIERSDCDGTNYKDDLCLPRRTFIVFGATFYSIDVSLQSEETWGKAKASHGRKHPFCQY